MHILLCCGNTFVMRGVYNSTVVLTGMFDGPVESAANQRCRQLPPWGSRRANWSRRVNGCLRLKLCLPGQTA